MKTNEVALIEDKQIAGTIFDIRIIDVIATISNKLSGSKLVPAHLQGKPDDCFLVTQQAFRWGIDPLAVAQGTSIVSGKMCYEGKLVAAVIEKMAGVVLDYEYSGEGQERKIKVLGQRRSDDRPRDIEIILKDVKTTNDKWSKMPDQMLAYRGSREWARRWTPGALLGIYADDEIEEGGFGGNRPMKVVGSNTTGDPILDALSEKPEPEQSKKKKITKAKVGRAEGGQVTVEIIKENPVVINQGFDLGKGGGDTMVEISSNQEEKEEVETHKPEPKTQEQNTGVQVSRFEIKDFRLTVESKKGTKIFSSCLEAKAHLEMIMKQMKYKIDREKLIKENSVLMTELDYIDGGPMQNALHELARQGV